MRDIIENKEIKVNERNIIPLAEVKEESDVTLNLELYKNNMPFDVTGQSIKLGLLINNKLIAEQSDGITINKNIVTIKLKNSFIQPGKLELDLTLTDNTGRMTTSSFYLIVNKKTIGGTSIQGTDLLETLDQIILDFEINFRETINGIKADYDSLKRIIIDENQAANLQEQINVNKNRIEQLEDLTPVWQEHDGVGNITINDSFDGTTKDLTIKGRTLKNIFLNPAQWYVAETGKYASLDWDTSLLKTNTTYTILFFNVVSSKVGRKTGFIGDKIFPAFANKDIEKPIVATTRQEFIDSKTHKIHVYPAINDIPLTLDDVREIKVMFIEGDCSANPPREYFDSITSCGEQEDNKILIKSIGKNLCSDIYKDVNLSKVSTYRGVEIPNRMKKGKQYYISSVVKGDMLNGTLIVLSTHINPNLGGYVRVWGNGNGSYKQSIPAIVANSEKLYISLYCKDKTPTEEEYSKIMNSIDIQLEEGSLATNYEQFRAKLIEIPLPFEGGLKSLPNGISDEIYDNGKLIQKIEKRVYKSGDELLPNVITDKKNTIIELSKYKTYDINPFFLRTFNETTHLYQENNICGEVSFEIAKDRDAIINGNTESISKLNKISESHIEESKNKNNELQQSIDSNSVNIRGIETKIKNFVTLEELGAVGNGIADDLPALNKAMQLMLQGKIKKVVGNGVYAISNSFHINNKNDITFEVDTIIPTNNFPRNSSLIVIGQSSAGSMANITLKINLLDGKNIANGLNIFSCGSSLFDIKTAINMSKFVNIYNPSKICSDNKFTGNNVRQCGFGFIIKSEEQSACEGTIIDYNFIYDCKYAGILLDKGSHYADIRSALDFNGKYSLILELNSVSGIAVGDTLNIGDETITVVSIYGNFIYCISNKNVDKGKTAFKKDVSIPSTGKTIKSVITANSDQNVFLDIINANNKAGFSRNIITSQYCGGIHGDKNSINTDFVVSYRTGQNENINIQGLEVATNSESVRLIEGRTGNNLFNYKSQEKVIELNNVQISGSRQNNVLPAGASDHPVASVQDLLDGLYSVNVIAQGRVDYVYQGLLVKYNSSKSITKIASVNVDLKVDETDTIKATNGSGSLSPTIAIYFTRLASY